MKTKAITALMMMLFLASVAIAHADETHDITGLVNATVTRTDGYDAITFSIVITSTGAHYGVGIAFATSTVQPAFQVWYREYELPHGWYYQDWTGTGWHGWGGAVIPLIDKAGEGFSATGDHTGPTFTITVPTTALGGPGATYYYGIQVRTLSLNHYPSNFGWTSHETLGIAASYHSATVPVPPPSQVWVDDDWAGSSPGDPVDGHTFGTDAFDVIQDGVDAVASGGVVHVAAGTYGEWVDVAKPVTLLGANADIHPAVGMHPTKTVGTRGPESILTYTTGAIRPKADNIVVDGFMFTGAGARLIDTYSDANNFHLTNCIFEDPVFHPTTGTVQFGGGSHTDMLVDFNLFKDRGDHTLYFGGGPYDGLHIAYNKFNVEGDSIFWGATPLVDGVVEYNEFDGTIDETPGVGFGTMNIGAGGNIIIRHNWFHDQQYTAFQIGIIDGYVTDNIFERIYPLSGSFADAFQLWGGQYGTPVSTNVIIEHNVIRYNDILGASFPSHGIRLRPPSGGPGIDGATIHINYNSFEDGGARTDAYAIRHQGEPGTVVDAEYNWWGNVNGPYDPVGTVEMPYEPEPPVTDMKNTEPTGNLGGMVGEYVDYYPWLGAPFEVYTMLEDLKTEIDDLTDGDFKPPAADRTAALIDKINEVIAKIDAGDYQGAMMKLLNDIKPKLDYSAKQAWLVTDHPELLDKITVIVGMLQGM